MNVRFVAILQKILNQFTNKMISLIVAYAQNNVIGKDGRIPWDLPQDREHFKKLTLGSLVIMGRRTFEEIYKKFGGGLPGRETIVLSKSREYCGENYRTVGSLGETIEIAGADFAAKDVYICGGESVYREALESGLVEKLYITEINLKIEGDAFFPTFDKEAFSLTERQTFKTDLEFSFLTYTRR